MTQPIHPVLERVARAIAGQLGETPEDWRDYLDAARAAIQALLEPDGSQVIAGNLCLYDHLQVDAHDLPEMKDGAAAATLAAMLKPLLGGDARQSTPGVYGPDQGLAPEGR